jgi:hypothetical protein
MRKWLSIFLLTGCSLVCVAQSVVPTLWTPNSDKYDHVGKMTFTPGVKKNLLDGRDDVYYSGDYACVGGDEHHAPNCDKLEMWIIWVVIPHTTFELEDGKKLVENYYCSDQYLSAGPVYLNDDFCTIAHSWHSSIDQEYMKAPAEMGAFLYRTVRDKKHPGQYGILVDYANKQSSHYVELRAKTIEAGPDSLIPTFH